MDQFEKLRGNPSTRIYTEYLEFLRSHQKTKKGVKDLVFAKKKQTHKDEKKYEQGTIVWTKSRMSNAVKSQVRLRPGDGGLGVDGRGIGRGGKFDTRRRNRKPIPNQRRTQGRTRVVQTNEQTQP